MKDLKLGDKVLVDDQGTYEPVYSFGHYSRKVEATYLRFIATGNDRYRLHSLEMSQSHLVFLEGRRTSVPASHVQVGDKLLLVAAGAGTSDTKSNIVVVVLEIQVVKRRGAYAPFTPSGTVVVNGFKASSFVAFQNSTSLHIV